MKQSLCIVFACMVAAGMTGCKKQTAGPEPASETKPVAVTDSVPSEVTEAAEVPAEAAGGDVLPDLDMGDWGKTETLTGPDLPTGLAVGEKTVAAAVPDAPIDPDAIVISEQNPVNDPDPAVIRDTVLFDDGYPGWPRDNDGGRNSEQLYVLSNSGEERRRYSLIKFGLDAIPAGSRIEKAELRLYCMQGSGSVSVCPLNEEWGGGLGTSYNFREGAWWNDGEKPFDPTAASNDYNAGAGVTATVTAGAYNSWNVTAIVNNWIAGTQQNCGLVIMTDDWQSFSFASSNNGDSGTMPKLIVTLAK